MTNHNVAALVLWAGETKHFTEMLNACIKDVPRDPVMKEEAVYPYLEDLESYLNRETGPKTTREELKVLISRWIDEKIDQAVPVPRGG